MEKNYNGIDYGLGLSNQDHKTGIRYGVISQHEVLQAWADESEVNFPCKNCDFDPGEIESLDECEFCEPSSYVIDNDEYSAECGEDGDIFITKSPFYTLCQYCSPCAPGAGYLMNRGDVKAYCFGHDWFESGKAPYKVYSVKTNRLV